MYDSKKLGLRIKRIRQIKRITIMNLSEKAGVNKNTISKAEKGDKSISLDSLDKIANGLEVQLSDLMDNKAVEDVDYILHLIKDNPTEYIKAPRELRHYLRTPSPTEPNKTRSSPKTKLGDLRLGLKKGALLASIVEVGREFEEMHTHSGEELFFCLTGRILVSIEGEEIELYKGDAILFWGKVKHTYRCLATDENKVSVGLSVIANSGFESIEDIRNHIYGLHTEEKS